MKSSVIHSVGSNNSTLVITFKHRDGTAGKTYAYECPSPDAAFEHHFNMETAPSAGKYFHEHIASMAPACCIS